MKNHPLTQSIPPHLAVYITKQDYSLYTPIDQACWRFILKLSQVFFEKHAHQKYLDGLRETGISIERIPLIEEMDKCLKKFNWRAVSVSGFIPPAAFMEFLSLGILPIACDMRTLEHIAYTPAPDIVHEAAGHAPIIADPEYAEYLRSYGEISKKAISSIEDLQVYEAIRNLSETKEDPSSTTDDIAKAQNQLNQAVQALTYVSEATLLSRMGWWTFEYGLFGSISQPKIYGAGLLSSLSESFHYLDSSVKKIPFSIDCVQTSYDITRPQPQLFVSPNFQLLQEALSELGNRMAYKTGGREGLLKAIQCKTVTTVVLDTGIQISGILQKFLENKQKQPIYMSFTGPSQLSLKDHEIDGHGTQYHVHGFGTPLETITEAQLQNWGIKEGTYSKFTLSSGIEIEGTLLKRLMMNEKLMILTFDRCKVTFEGQTLFQPEWGLYDMACGKNVVSVFGGPADREKFGTLQKFSNTLARTPKTNLTTKNRELCLLYQRVRQIRETPSPSQADLTHLNEIHEKLQSFYPQDWLLRFEILELLAQAVPLPKWASALYQELRSIAASSPVTSELIERGIALLPRNFIKSL